MSSPRKGKNMNNNTINMTVELCAADRARLDKILEALAGMGHHSEKAAQAVTETTPAVEKLAPEPVTEAPAEATEDLPFPAQEEVTPEDIQNLVRKLAAPETGKREACKAIITKYADNVSSIPADKRREVMDALLDLTAEG